MYINIDYAILYLYCNINTLNSLCTSRELARPLLKGYYARKDMDFIFEWWSWKQYFKNGHNERVKYCFYHKKIKSISTSHCVILLHRFNAKSGKILNGVIDIFTSEDAEYDTIFSSKTLYYNKADFFGCAQASQNDLKCNLYLSVKVYNITV